MIDFFVFDINRNLIGEISEYSNAEITRNFFTYSQVVLNLPATDYNLSILKKDNIITTQTATNYGYVIQHIEYNDSEREFLEVVAFSLNFLLSYRTVYPQQYVYGNQESVIRSLVQRNIISPTSNNRRIPGLVLGTYKNIGVNLDTSVTGGDILTTSMALANSVGATVDIFIDETTRNLVLEVYSGTDRSDSQNINPKVVFSKDFDNIYNQIYFNSDIDMKNAAIVAGEGEGASRVIVDTSTLSGVNRRELFVDARDLQSEITNDGGGTTTLTPAQYRQTLAVRGTEALQETVNIETLEADVENTQYIYGVDYFLGDTVTIRSDKLGLMSDVLVNSVVITSSKEGVKVIPSLGSVLPNLYKRR